MKIIWTKWLKKEIEPAKKSEATQEQSEEKEPISQGLGNTSEIDKYENLEKNECQEIEPKSKEELELKIKTPIKGTQNTINKF